MIVLFHFFTVGRIGDMSSMFLYSLWLKTHELLSVKTVKMRPPPRTVRQAAAVPSTQTAGDMQQRQ